MTPPQLATMSPALATGPAVCNPGFFDSTEFGGCFRCARQAKCPHGSLVVCPSGIDQPNFEQTSCCPPRYVEVTAANTGSCVRCSDENNEYPNADGTSCLTCAANYVINWFNGGKSCSPCNAGTDRSTSVTNCTTCDANSISSKGGSCTACSMFLLPNEERTACNVKCNVSRGFVYNITTKSCNKCAPGYHLNPNPLNINARFAAALGGGGEPRCDACPVGTANDDPMKTSCATCKLEGAGYFAPFTRMSKCDLCGNSKQLVCPSPEGNPAPDDQCSCQSCAGYSNATTGQRCRYCPLGERPLWNQSGCERCPQHSKLICPAHTIGTKSCYCEGCSVNHIQNETGTGCRLCEAGSVSKQLALDDEGNTFDASSGKCVKCAAGEYFVNNSEPSKRQCMSCQPGSYALREGELACTRCRVGRYKNESGSSTHCDFCPSGHNASTKGSTHCEPCPINTFSPQMGADFCIPCPPNAHTLSANGSISCVNISLTRSSSFSLDDNNSSTQPLSWSTASLSESSPATESSSNNESTATRQRSHGLTDSFSQSAPLTDSVEPSATQTLSTSPAPTETDARDSVTAHSSHSSSTSTSSSKTQSATFPSRSDSAGGANLSVSPSVAESKSRTETIHILPPPPPLGLSAAAAAQLQQANSIMGVLVSATAAPAAMSLSRGVAVLSLIGCPPRAPSGKKWDESVNFPSSLLPGVEIGGSQSRASIIAFLSLVVVVFFAGFLATETLGGNMNEMEKQQSEEKEDEQNPSFVVVSAQNDDQQGESPLLRSSSSSESATTAPPPQKASRMPFLVFTAFSAVIGLWAPQAGLMVGSSSSSTGIDVGDLALAFLPIIAVFSLHIYYSVKLHRSLFHDEWGVYFAPSFILERTKALIRPKGGHHSWLSAKGIFESDLGRRCLLGENFYARPRGRVGRRAAELLCNLGSVLQKHRGPKAELDWLSTANPAKKAGFFRVNFAAPTSQEIDFEEEEHPSIKREQPVDLATTISPHFLLISWFFCAACGILQGVGLVLPGACPGIAKVICGLNVLSFVVLLWLRPMVVPVRNIVLLLLDGTIAVVSILVSAALASGDDEAQAKFGGLAMALQVIVGIVGNVCAALLLGGAGARFLLLKLTGARIVSQEEAWAVAQHIISQEQEMATFGGDSKNDGRDPDAIWRRARRPLPPPTRGGLLPPTLSRLFSPRARAEQEEADEESRRFYMNQERQDKAQVEREQDEQFMEMLVRKEEKEQQQPQSSSKKTRSGKNKSKSKR